MELILSTVKFVNILVNSQMPIFIFEIYQSYSEVEQNGKHHSVSDGLYVTELSLFLNKFHDMKNYGWVEVKLLDLLISWPDGDECSALPLDQHVPGVLSIQFTEDFVGLKTSQYLVVEE
jgi:hypothetical protein